jgi:hypothetical protein
LKRLGVGADVLRMSGELVSAAIGELMIGLPFSGCVICDHVDEIIDARPFKSNII